MDLVSANLVLAGTKKPFTKPYVVRKAGTVKVAFTGLIGKDMKIREFPGDAKLEILDPGGDDGSGFSRSCGRRRTCGSSCRTSG
jgi:hypothetical protein